MSKSEKMAKTTCVLKELSRRANDKTVDSKQVSFGNRANDKMSLDIHDNFLNNKRSKNDKNPSE